MTIRQIQKTCSAKVNRIFLVAALVGAGIAGAGCGASVPEEPVASPPPAATGIVVSIEPSFTTVPPSGGQRFAAAVTGSALTTVTWSVQEGASGGSVSNGQYTAPGTSGTYHVVVTSVADPTKSATAVVTVADSPVGTPSALGPKMGTNLNWMVDWDPEKLAADLMYEARPWAVNSLNGANTADWTAIDAQGWPIVSVGTPFGTQFEYRPWPGVYKLSFQNRQGTTGDTVTSAGGSGVVVSNRQHNPTTNVTTYDVTVTTYQEQFIHLRWAGSTGGVTDVHLMRPLGMDSATYNAAAPAGWHPVGTILSDYIVNRLAHFSAIRTMQTQTGCSDKSVGRDSAWSDRTRPWSSQQRSGVNGRFGGVALELLVGMANQSNKDLWINVPFYATDDYITKMAQLIRYGSDGVNPYTSPQASPVFPPLAPNLNVYVEFANEVWNGGGYWSNENEAATSAEIAAGDRNHFNYRQDGIALSSLAFRRVGYQAVRHSLIFRGVFGDAAMMTRVRPVLAGQHGNYGTLDEALEYIKAVYGVGNVYGNPANPVPYYIYGIATAPYVPSGNGEIDVTSAATIIASTVANFYNTTDNYPGKAITDNAARARTWGVKYLAYEGGGNIIPDGLPGGATAANIQKAKDANYDPVLGARFGAAIDPTTGLPLSDQSQYVYGSLLKRWGDTGSDLFMHFTLGEGANSGSMFGLSPPSSQSSSDTRLETGPKWDAIKAFKKAWGY